MHALAALVAAATPSPSPSGVNPDLVTPGPWGFAAVAFIGIVVILLVWDMLRRIRRARYREEVAAELDAEEKAAAEGDSAVRDTDVDDRAIDAGDDEPSGR